MKCFLFLLVPVSALRIQTADMADGPKFDKPLCTKAEEMSGGAGGKWKLMQESKYDPMPGKISRGQYRGYQMGCNYDKFLMYEPNQCRLPHFLKDIDVRPKRVMFMGDSVMDISASSFAWFAQKENRITDQKPCGFQKAQMEEHLKKSGLFDEQTIKDTSRWMVQQGGNNKRNGHVWWGCKNSSVLYAPVLKLEPENPEVIKALMYTVKTFADGEPLGPKDVIVMNWGLHGFADGKKGNLEHMDKAWTPALTLILKEWAKWKAEGTAPKLIWREISPQHFPNAGGTWNANTKKTCGPIGNKVALYKDKTTVPLKNNMMFQQAVQDAGLKIDGKDIEVLPVWQATAERYDEHPTGDCTHYCQFGAVNRYWNSALLATASGMLKTK